MRLNSPQFGYLTLKPPYLLTHLHRDPGVTPGKLERVWYCVDHYLAKPRQLGQVDKRRVELKDGVHCYHVIEKW